MLKKLFLCILNIILFFFTFFFKKLYNIYLDNKIKNNNFINIKFVNIIYMIYWIIINNFIFIIYYFKFFIIILCKNYKFYFIYIYLEEYKNLLSVLDNNKSYNILSKWFIYYYYYIKVILNLIHNSFIIQLLFILHYFFNYYYLVLMFYYLTIKRYIFYIYNLIKIFLVNKKDRLNLYISEIRNFNYSKFGMRVSYVKVKYWYDYRTYKERLELKKKYMVNSFLYKNEKVIYYFIKQKVTKLNLKFFVFLKSFISILVFFKDKFLMSETLRILKKMVKRIKNS